MTRNADRSDLCRLTQERLEDYLADRLAPADHAAFWNHAGGCRTCLETILARDPARVFGGLSCEEPGETFSRGDEFWRGFWPAIEEGIRTAPARPARGISRRGIAAILAAAAGLAGLLLLLPRLIPNAPPVGEPPAATRIAAAPKLIDAGTGPWPPTVEQVRTDPSHDVQVFSMTYYQGGAPDASEGAAQSATDLVLIVDAGLDL